MQKQLIQTERMTGAIAIFIKLVNNSEADGFSQSEIPDLEKALECLSKTIGSNFDSFQESSIENSSVEQIIASNLIESAECLLNSVKDLCDSEGASETQISDYQEAATIFNKVNNMFQDALTRKFSERAAELGITVVNSNALCEET